MEILFRPLYNSLCQLGRFFGKLGYSLPIHPLEDDPSPGLVKQLRRFALLCLDISLQHLVKSTIYASLSRNNFRLMCLTPFSITQTSLQFVQHIDHLCTRRKLWGFTVFSHYTFNRKQ